MLWTMEIVKFDIPKILITFADASAKGIDQDFTLCNGVTIHEFSPKSSNDAFYWLKLCKGVSDVSTLEHTKEEIADTFETF